MKEFESKLIQVGDRIHLLTKTGKKLVCGTKMVDSVPARDGTAFLLCNSCYAFMYSKVSVTEGNETTASLLTKISRMEDELEIAVDTIKTLNGVIEQLKQKENDENHTSQL